MYDFVYKNKRLMQFILALITLPFAFFGIDSYFRASNSADVVATVDGYKITQNEFAQALRERQDSLQRMSGNRLDPAMLDNSEARFAVVEGLIQQQLLVQRAQQLGFAVTDRQVQEIVNNIDAFKEDGKFSYSRYEGLLKSQGMSPLSFEQSMRKNIILDQVAQPFGAASFVSRAEAALLLRITEQQREISYFTVANTSFLPQIKLADDAVQKYYDSHQDELKTAEQVQLEFVVLSAEGIAARSAPSTAEVRKAYDENIKRYEAKESREASHILIAVDASGGADAKVKAKIKADQLYTQLKAKPQKFAALAKEHSQDPGSATKGGDLGYFERGSMVKAFDDAVFGMKAGEISAPVESEFGYHIIRLANVRGGKVKTFDQARPEIEAELKKQNAARKFAELAESFSNALFEHPDSLKAAAEIAMIEPQKSAWISRSGGNNPLLSNPKFIGSVFSEEVLRNKKNSDAVEVAPGILIAARVIDYKPSTIKPIDDVKDELIKKLTNQQAAQLAAQDGRAQIDAMREGKGREVRWSSALMVGRGDPKGVPVEVLRQAFKVDATKTPAYTGVELPNGYALVKVTQVKEGVDTAKDKQNAISRTMSQVVGQAELAAYIASLRTKADVKIKQEAIEKKS